MFPSVLTARRSAPLWRGWIGCWSRGFCARREALTLGSTLWGCVQGPQASAERQLCWMPLHLSLSCWTVRRSELPAPGSHECVQWVHLPQGVPGFWVPWALCKEQGVFCGEEWSGAGAYTPTPPHAQASVCERGNSHSPAHPPLMPSKASRGGLLDPGEADHPLHSPRQVFRSPSLLCPPHLRPHQCPSIPLPIPPL